VAALAVVNAVGTATVGDGPWFWAAPFEIEGEFGGRGLPPSFTPEMLAMRLKGAAAATAVENTTLAVVVTDAILTKPQAKRLAMIAQTGFVRIASVTTTARSEEHTSELQSRSDLVCRLLLEKKK